MDRVTETFRIGEEAARDKVSEVRHLMRSRRPSRRQIPAHLPALVIL